MSREDRTQRGNSSSVVCPHCGARLLVVRRSRLSPGEIGGMVLAEHVRAKHGDVVKTKGEKR
jgi:hypothetical protein